MDPSLDNYFEVFRRINMANVFKNTLLYIGLILLFDLIVNSICGYALAKFSFKGRRLMLSFVMTILKKVLMGLAPSMEAASKSSLGTPLKKL